MKKKSKTPATKKAQPNWTAIAADLLFTKNDPQDPRLGEKVKILNPLIYNNLEKNLFSKSDLISDFKKNNKNINSIIFGYPDDEGILLNGGRMGARMAPYWIRRFLYRMTPNQLINDFELLDIGDLNIDNFSLSDRHEQGKSIAKFCYQNKPKQCPLISLGGGHDYGYADGAGFLNHFKNSKIKPLIINFDAHLDVRPVTVHKVTKKPIYNSGTPFFRLIQEFKKSFHFLEVGIQDQCNSPYHKNWLIENQGHILDLETLRHSTIQTLTKKSELKNKTKNNTDSDIQSLNNSMEMLKILETKIKKMVPAQTPTFLSIDMDVFSSDAAPGCSQSWPQGLTYSEFKPMLMFLKNYLNIQGLGLYETSPALDYDHRTSKLAATIIYQFLFQ